MRAEVVSISREALARLPQEDPELRGAFTRVRVWALRLRLLLGVVRVANATLKPGSRPRTASGSPSAANFAEVARSVALAHVEQAGELELVSTLSGDGDEQV